MNVKSRMDLRQVNMFCFYYDPSLINEKKRKFKMYD